MISVTYIEANGTRHEVSAPAGESLMQAALNNAVPGILGDCGGNCACATCHCYLDAEWQSQLAPPEQYEKDLLEHVLEPRDNSRLSCQIKLSSELDGLTVHIPAEQG